MKRANIVSSIFLLIIAILIFGSSVKMQYLTKDGVPGPGFMPLWTSVFIGIVALLILYMNIVRNKPDSDKNPEFDKKFWLNSVKVLGVSAACLLITKLTGMLAAIGLMTGFLSWLFGTKSTKTNILLVIIPPVVFYFVFQVGLEIIFPKGLLGF